jgi:hypothetical protein
MKKLFAPGIVTVFAIMFTSCKKDYTCKCTYTVNGTTVELGTTTIHATKDNAKNACNAELSTFMPPPGASYPQCAIQ